MPKHEQPYIKSETEGQKLTDDCGHHCGIIQVGGTDTHTGHCNCTDCHGHEAIVTEVDPVLMPGMSADGVDPRGIR